MRLIFKYDLEKEYTNFSVAFKSINHSVPSKIQKLFNESYQDLNKENVIKFVEQYVEQNNISMEEKVKDISKKWEIVGDDFFTRADQIFKTVLPQNEINVFLTINDRCSYNFERNYFFVHLNLRMTNKTLMHEMLHWYFHFTVGMSIKKIFGENIYNDIKESLPVLLNTELKYLLEEGVEDKGNPQHQLLREEIAKNYKTDKDIYKTIGYCVKLLLLKNY